MSLRALMSAAHAAGYALVPQEVPEPRVDSVPLLPAPDPDPVAAVRRAVPAVVPAHRPARTEKLREFFWDYWPGRATA